MNSINHNENNPNLATIAVREATATEGYNDISTSRFDHYYKEMHLNRSAHESKQQTLLPLTKREKFYDVKKIRRKTQQHFSPACESADKIDVNKSLASSEGFQKHVELIVSSLEKS